LGSSDQDAYGWRIAAIAFAFTFALQTGGALVWFGGWKETTDLRLFNMEKSMEKTEQALTTTNKTLQSVNVQQQVMSAQMSALIRTSKKYPLYPGYRTAADNFSPPKGTTTTPQ